MRLLARMYDQGGSGVGSAWRGKKESERKNRKNATGRKYVVEIAQCRREVRDRPLLDRHPLFGSMLPLRAGNVEAREGRSRRREGSAISYTLRVNLPHTLSYRDRKIYRRPSIEIAYSSMIYSSRGTFQNVFIFRESYL